MLTGVELMYIKGHGVWGGGGRLPSVTGETKKIRKEKGLGYAQRIRGEMIVRHGMAQKKYKTRKVMFVFE